VAWDATGLLGNSRAQSGAFDFKGKTGVNTGHLGTTSAAINPTSDDFRFILMYFVDFCQLTGNIGKCLT
jgi:hypothetical protein